MRRIPLVQWAKVLVGAAVLVTGCDDIESYGSSEIELRDEDQAETLGDPDAQADVDEEVPKGQANVIPGRYIVKLKPGANPQNAANAVHATPDHVFTQVMSGFSGKLSPAQLKALKSRADVLRIEPDGVVSIADAECPSSHPTVYTQTKANGAHYGLDRTDQEDLPLGGSYKYSWNGSGVNVYIVDTGIETKHSEFNGRAKATYDAYRKKNSKWFAQDCHGHGTHVAGIVGGKTYGLAKHVTLHSVRVLDCNGSGSWSRLISALDWIAEHADKPAVVNMSLSGSPSMFVDEAVENLVDEGIVVVVAAGNKNASACNYSPARAPEAFTVAASNSNDDRASFSNYGSCVDMYAPGTNIRSAWLNNKNTTASGTSMSAPHVAGVAALYLDAFDGSVSHIEDDLEDWAGKGKIGGNPSNTANLLVHWPCWN